MMRIQWPAAAVFIWLFLAAACAHAQIVVSTGQTAQVLARRLAGQGVAISGATLHCPGIASGLFTAAPDAPGIDSGIVLTTGRAATTGTAYGVDGYSIFLASNDLSVPGDVALNALAHQATYDACALEFDVVPDGDTLRFNYVFSSEEYLNAVCGPYNDVFAFFISGTGIPGVHNMALVPATTIPVTINSINNGIPGITGNISNCTAMGPGAPFTTYYVDNSGGSHLTHKGRTAVMQAIHQVSPCGTYHLKLVIADAGDPLYDSGVFIEAGSLQTTSFHISAQQTAIRDTHYAFCVKGCLPGRFTVRRSVATSIPQTIRLRTGGTAISGIDYAPLPDSVLIPAGQATATIPVAGLLTPARGSRNLQLYILPPAACSGNASITDSAGIIIYDSVHISIATPDTITCRNDSVSIFVNGDSLLTYRWAPTAGVSDYTLKDPAVAPAASTTYTVTAVLPGSVCGAATATVHIGVRATPSIVLSADTTVCIYSAVDITARTQEANDHYRYSWSGPGHYTTAAATLHIDSAMAASNGAYTIHVINDTNQCQASSAIMVHVSIPQAPVVATPVVLCLNSTPRQLTAPADSLLWYAPGDTATHIAPAPPTGASATFTYFVARQSGYCISPAEGIQVQVKECCEGLISIPSAFTPNNDGLNDRFQPLPDYGYFITSMQVFNRWGQVVYAATGHAGWDGNFGGRPADPGTYYYSITFGCLIGGSVTRKGDVLLIR